MVVTLSVAELSAALRLTDSAEETAEATRLLAYASEAVIQYAPDAVDTAHTEACIRLASYIYDQPTAGRGDSYANALRNSGAARMLLPYRIHRAGYSDAVASAQQAVGTVGNPVIDVDFAGETLTVTYADNRRETFTIAGGGGGGFVLGDVANGRLPSIVPMELRVGWVETLLSPITAATFAATSGANIGNNIDGVEVPMYPVTYLEQYAGIVIWLAGDAIPTSLYPNYAGFGDDGVVSTPLRVDGVDGVYWDSAAVYHSSNTGQVIYIVLPGELLATQDWVEKEIAKIPPGGGEGGMFSGTDQTARDAALAAQATADTNTGLVGANNDLILQNTAKVVAAQSDADTAQNTVDALSSNAIVDILMSADGATLVEWRTDPADNSGLLLPDVARPASWAHMNSTDTIPASALPDAFGAYDWAQVGHDELQVPSAKVNLDGVQSQIDDIHAELAHAGGEITEVVGVLGSGNSSLRYTLPTDLNGEYDVSVRVKVRVQVNEFVNFTGNVHITSDGSLELNPYLLPNTHNYHNTHEATLNFLSKGLSIFPGPNQINFTTEVTGSSPPEVHFIEVENLTLTNTSLVNSGNVTPYIADWAEEGNNQQIPGGKLSLGAQAIGAFQQVDIDAIPNGGSQLFVYQATVLKDMDSTLAYVGGGWTKAAAAAGGAGGQWYWVSQAVGPFTANTAKDATTILQFPVAGFADYAALEAAVVDSTIPQIAIRILEIDAGASDDDGANFIIPNINAFRFGIGSFRAFPAWNVGVDPVKFDVVFGPTNVTVKADTSVGQTLTVIVRIAVWS